MNNLKINKVVTFAIIIILLFQVNSISSSLNVHFTDSTPITNKPIASKIAVENTTYSIVVSQPFIQDFVQNIVGNLFRVTSVVKGSQDPHSYTPTISDTLVISSSNIFMYYGVADIDGWVSGIISSIPKSVHIVKLVNLSQDGLYDPYIGSGELNPHLWMWPSFVNSTLIQRIYDSLVKFDPTHVSQYKNNLETYRMKLDSLIQRVQGNATVLKGIKVVEYHAAFFYLLRELNITRLGAIEQIEDQQPSAVHFANISNTIKQAVESGNTVLIVQSMNIPPDTSWQIARDTGAKISYVAALLGSYSKVNFTSYIQMIDYDLVALTHPEAPPSASVPSFTIISTISLVLLGIAIIISRKRILH